VVDTVGRPSQPELIENDLRGNRVVRNEVLALSPTAASLAIARGLNFQIVRQTALGGLGLQVTVLRPPAGLSATEAVDALRQADPQGAYDFNHIYDPTAGVLGNVRSLFKRSPSSDARGVSIGLVDAGIDRSHPALRRARITAENFAGTGRSPESEHGTAIASLLVGDGGSVNSVLPGATLYAADVFGGKGVGGSAEAVARGLAWVAERGAPVINVSLVGPENRALKAVVDALLARGHVIVAAVGNEGPARAVGYPAAYEGVVAVTSVDAERRIQIDANRGPQIAFAAVGVDVAVAGLNKSYVQATGTSFAAPLVASRFALKMTRPDVTAFQRAHQELRNEAIDLGPKGRDEIFGYGFLDAQPATVVNTSMSAR
jgi:subtilisin family serine protease